MFATEEKSQMAFEYWSQRHTEMENDFRSNAADAFPIHSTTVSRRFGEHNSKRSIDRRHD